MFKSKSNWVSRSDRMSRPLMRLFCFPYAGGSSSIFHRWPKHMGSDWDVCAVHLPGRGIRLSEPPIRDMQEMVLQIAAGIQDYLDVPYAFFGHSMGALLAHELTLHFSALRKPLPRLLVVSGRQAPDVEARRYDFSHLTDEQFREELRSLNAETDRILAEPALRRMLLPVLRADFQLCDTWQPKPTVALDVPIIAMAGSEDSTVSPAMVEPWRRHTCCDFSMHVLPGDHFFVSSAGPQICELIRGGLQSAAGSCGSESNERAVSA